MSLCRGSFSRSHGRCPVCGEPFSPSLVPGLCITVPEHEPLEVRPMDLEPVVLSSQLGAGALA